MDNTVRWSRRAELTGQWCDQHIYLCWCLVSGQFVANTIRQSRCEELTLHSWLLLSFEKRGGRRRRPRPFRRLHQLQSLPARGLIMREAIPMPAAMIPGYQWNSNDNVTLMTPVRGVNSTVCKTHSRNHSKKLVLLSGRAWVCVLKYCTKFRPDKCQWALWFILGTLKNNILSDCICSHFTLSIN